MVDAATRALVRDRAGDRCEYCRLPQRHAPLVPHQIDHVRAVQHDGSDDPANLALACGRCNLNKGPNLTGVDRRTGRVTPLFHPRSQAWEEHFRWSGPLIVGTTAAGRATVATLKMNEEARLRVRRTRGTG